ncbi:MAG TPA: SDR family oxidoreductase [Candidatus Acidoferrales bacterium]|nr:SDR family oxidoreductase [Candidatus Acidoferrales bacterium]
MGIFLTGSTGYIGAHVTANLLAECREPLNLLVRAKNQHEARERLWRALQLHMEFPEFLDTVDSRIRIFLGELTQPQMGIESGQYSELVRSTDSVIHCAASLNRKSEKACLNVNLRGTLQVVELAMRARENHGLRRFSHVSTVAVAGQRQNEVIEEDSAIDWDRSDYDPYARTKKFCEHMIAELLPNVPRTIFRPSIVLGDSRKPETNQFDMVRAFVFLASLPVLPFHARHRVDIVPVDYVAAAISRVHLKEKPEYSIYHLSSGRDSETYGELTAALASAQGKRAPLFAPSLESSTKGMVNLLSGRFGKTGKVATLLKVFLPYLTWNTVFDNSRVISEMDRRPVPFSQYCYGLLKFSRENHFMYPYRQWPRSADATDAREPRPAGTRP